MPPSSASGAAASRIPAPRAAGETPKPGIGSGLYVADGPGLELVAPKVPTTFEVRNTSGAAVKVSSGTAFSLARKPVWALQCPLPGRASRCGSILDVSTTPCRCRAIIPAARQCPQKHHMRRSNLSHAGS